MSKIISVVGARPNFMKVAPIARALTNHPYEHLIVHTGQHYDYNLSDSFFVDLELPKPDYFLGVGSGSHSEQTAKIMVEFEKILIKEQPDLVIVVGDVNSTIACGLTSVKMGIKLAHIEAGLRSFDKSMPEEVNRIATDSIADYFFVTEESGLINLKNMGADENNTFFVGNTMIDSLVFALPKIVQSKILENFNLTKNNFVLTTLHRPSNVDNYEKLSMFLDIFNYISQFAKIVLPIHPRTRKNLIEFGLIEKYKQISNLIITEPLSYLDFIKLMQDSKFVMTDSGGIQEESTFLDVPCLTLRTSTERPITIELGTNLLINPEYTNIVKSISSVLENPTKRISIPPLWDGHSAERIVNIIQEKILKFI
jgi:UDP-N-acetylglucosamine 2-epimerase (non-hydrolysing)